MLMIKCSNQKDFNKLWNHAHYLKGSAAILGLIKLRGSCENIERMGKQMEEAVKQMEPKDDEDGGEENALGSLYNALSQAKMEFAEVEEVLKRFYEG
jgi:osomolarity two-component system phosphorelay intermediate protein YPD1